MDSRYEIPLPGPGSIRSGDLMFGFDRAEFGRTSLVLDVRENDFEYLHFPSEGSAFSEPQKSSASYDMLDHNQRAIIFLRGSDHGMLEVVAATRYFSESTGKIGEFLESESGIDC